MHPGKRLYDHFLPYGVQRQRDLLPGLFLAMRKADAVSEDPWQCLPSDRVDQRGFDGGAAHPGPFGNPDGGISRQPSTQRVIAVSWIGARFDRCQRKGLKASWDGDTRSAPPSCCVQLRYQHAFDAAAYDNGTKRKPSSCSPQTSSGFFRFEVVAEWFRPQLRSHRPMAHPRPETGNATMLFLVWST